MSRYRRVCDQAVDSLVFLLRLKLPFEVNSEKLYSASERKTIQDLAKTA
jgi:hypothetical protein